MTMNARIESANGTEPAEEEVSGGVLSVMRDWSDALIIAFILAMFLRVFIVELFKIPSGSMSPTLIGDKVAEVDRDGDGVDDLIVKGAMTSLVFLRKDGHYELDRTDHVSRRDLHAWERDDLLKLEEDRILVNKFAYWLKAPERGDVIVFKVPEAIWKRDKPIFIKRAVGLPGDRISFDGPLMANGRRIMKPDFFARQKYFNTVNTNQREFQYFSFVRYGRERGSRITIEEVRVPMDAVYAMGDNTGGSLDSRAWGPVPLENLKGKAFVRYWPMNKMKFIR